MNMCLSVCYILQYFHHFTTDFFIGTDHINLHIPTQVQLHQTLYYTTDQLFESEFNFRPKQAVWWQGKAVKIF